MLVPGVRDQAKAVAISRAVRHAKIRRTIYDLFFSGMNRGCALAIRFEFPAGDFRLRKPAAIHSAKKQIVDCSTDFCVANGPALFSAKMVPNAKSLTAAA